MFLKLYLHKVENEIHNKESIKNLKLCSKFNLPIINHVYLEKKNVPTWEPVFSSI